MGFKMVCNMRGWDGGAGTLLGEKRKNSLGHSN